ncbi:outer membrane heme receptor [Desulfosarcina ovata subsp. sediminis]|uniref:Outer membrane heme receptor n=1 Tax=Desulfosarcina ovata subsp. sediminis TaxID=885957 RepID=A0A5K7ZX12_9BACT|nr:TonB-dependent receptor [Desulfosarcina ovata]BBO84799.1 outer membrane heme receptor [Desulfosarcina ovata subsp. sediminis]
MHGLRFVVYWTVVLAFCLPMAVGADERAEETVKLREVVVSAPRTDRKLVETPASITVITGEEIEEMGARNIVDVVKNIPGVVKDSDSRDRLTFRGNRSSQSAGVLVLIDGVPANTGISGYSEYDAIPVSNIERIEVLRSSGSVALGPDAARGAINIITKKGQKGAPQVKTTVSYGSWETWKASASVTGRTADLDYAFSASGLDTDGYADDSKQRGAARLNSGYHFSEDTRLGINLSWQKVDYDTIYGKSEWQVENYRREKIFPTSETNPTLVHHRENENENTTVSLTFNTEKANYFVNSLVSYDHTDHVYDYLPKRLNPTYSKTSSYYDYREDRDQDRYMGKISGGYHFFFGGVNYTPVLGADYEKIEFDQEKSYPWSPSPLSSSQETAVAEGSIDTERKRYGAFISNELDFGEHWELNVSGRVDRVEYEVRNEVPEKVAKDHEDFSWDITPAFHPSPDATIYVSASQSYWYPVLQYYTYAMKYGDDQNRAEDLEPEEYLTYELGYKHYFGPKFSLALTAYTMTVKDKFLSLYDESNWKGYQNVGESEHRGVELELDGRLCPYFGYRLRGAYQHAEWDDATFRAYVWGDTPADDTRENVDISGEKVPHVPEFTGTLGLDFYFLEYFKFSTDVNYYGRQYVDVLNRYEINDYVTTDAMLSYTRENVKIWMLANNLFDREVENKFNETGDRNADGSPNYLYYPLDGRYLEVGVSVEF